MISSLTSCFRLSARSSTRSSNTQRTYAQQHQQIPSVPTPTTSKKARLQKWTREIITGKKIQNTNAILFSMEQGYAKHMKDMQDKEDMLIESIEQEINAVEMVKKFEKEVSERGASIREASIKEASVKEPSIREDSEGELPSEEEEDQLYTVKEMTMFWNEVIVGAKPMINILGYPVLKQKSKKCAKKLVFHGLSEATLKRNLIVATCQTKHEYIASLDSYTPVLLPLINPTLTELLALEASAPRIPIIANEAPVIDDEYAWRDLDDARPLLDESIEEPNVPTFEDDLIEFSL